MTLVDLNHDELNTISEQLETLYRLLGVNLGSRRVKSAIIDKMYDKPVSDVFRDLTVTWSWIKYQWDVSLFIGAVTAEEVRERESSHQ